MLIGSICAAIAICLLGGFLCFRYVRQTFDEVDHMLDQAIQGHFDFATIAGETRQGKLCHKVKRLIQKLQADAEESAVEKSNVQGIISDISHQMKTPLASICMYTSLLMEENLTPKETQEFLLRTKNSANRLQWMMDTLFKMSRLETGGKIVVIATRWHSQDLSGRILAHYKSIGVPVRLILEKAVQQDGSMLCEEVLNREAYDLIVKTMGKDIAEANYNQTPIDMVGRLYSGFKTYSQLPQDDNGNVS